MPVVTYRGTAWILAMGIAVSCGHPSTGAVTPDEDEPRQAEVSILVRNHNFLDMTVYLLRGSSPERLGTAQGLSDKIFLVPWRRFEGNSDIRLGADPIGQDLGIRTEIVSVRPGSIVEWTIESVMNRSYVVVR